MSILPSFGTLAHQTCQVFDTSAFRVVLGANLLDPTDHAANLVLGDIYNLHSEASSKTLIHVTATIKSEGSEKTLQVVAPGSEIGKAGTPITPISRLTFMSDDATLTEVLVLSIGNGDICIHPLRPLRPRFDYTLLTAEADTGYAEFATVGMVSFARGTKIELADGGHCAVEDIQSGMALRTRDHGAQHVQSVSFQTVSAESVSAPVVIPKDFIGNSAELLVSPEYPLYLADNPIEPGVLATEAVTLAKELIDDDFVYQRKTGVVDYFQIRMPVAAIIFAEGICAAAMYEPVLTEEKRPRRKMAAMPSHSIRRVGTPKHAAKSVVKSHLGTKTEQREERPAI